jgi:hypothetical protein
MVVEVESDDMQRVVEAGVLIRSLWKVEEKKVGKALTRLIRATYLDHLGFVKLLCNEVYRYEVLWECE